AYASIADEKARDRLVGVPAHGIAPPDPRRPPTCPGPFPVPYTFPILPVGRRPGLSDSTADSLPRRRLSQSGRVCAATRSVRNDGNVWGNGRGDGLLDGAEVLPQRP